MEFGRLTLICSLGIIASVAGIGCSESSGYINYVDLPAQKAETPDAAHAQPSTADAAVKPIPLATNGDTQNGTKPTTDNVEADLNQDNGTNTAEPAPTTSTVPLEPDVGTPEELPEIVVAQYPVSDEPREIKLLVKDKRFRTVADSDAVRVSYDDIDLLKVLNMHPVPVDAVKHFPDWLTALDGQRIRIRGYMYPPFKASELTGFILTRDTGACCFGPDPLIYFLISVKLAKGETTDYIDNKAFDVEGIFRIDPEADDSELLQLYRIEDARVLK